MDMREVLEKVKQGEISVEEAEHYFRKAPFDEMGYAKLDMHRQIRSGFPESFAVERQMHIWCRS